MGFAFMPIWVGMRVRGEESEKAAPHQSSTTELEWMWADAKSLFGTHPHYHIATH